MKEDNGWVAGLDVDGENRLLQHIARRMLADEHLADDVAQETWLAVLRGRLSRATRPQRLLKKVAHDIAVDLLRSKDRRRRREEQSEQRSSSPATDELVHDENVRCRILAVVQKLPEHYRRPLVLRFYDALPPRRIAVVMGLPVETVRTRLKRANALVRQRLEREFRDHPGGWPWALAVVRVGRSAARSGPWRWMRQVAVAAGVAGVVGLPLLEDRAVSSSSGPVASASAASATFVASAVGADSELALFERGPTLTTLRARVLVAEDGRPLAGAAVRASWGDRELEAATNAGGIAELVLPTGTEVTVHVAATDEAHGADVTLTTPAESVFDAHIDVPARRVVAGRVVDTAGAPVVGARVGAYREYAREIDMPLHVTTTDVEGRYAIAGLADTTFVSVAHDGLASLGVLVAGELGPGRHEVDFLMVGSTDFEGVVVDPDGVPVAGAAVGAWPMFGNRERVVAATRMVKAQRRGTTDETGRFRLTGLPAGRYTLTAYAGSFAPAETLVPPGASTTDLVLRLEPGVSAVVNVVGARGEPLEGAAVSVWATEPEPGALMRRRSTRRTDALGRVRFDARHPGSELALLVDAPGMGVRVVEPRAVPFEVTVALEPRLLEGRVTGAPVELAETVVHVRPQLDYGRLTERGLVQLREARSLVATAAVDADGRFRFEAAPEGPLEVWAEVRSSVDVRVLGRVAVAAEDRFAELVLEAGGGIGGRVVDERTRVVLPGAAATAYSQALGLRTATTTGPDGRFAFRLPAAQDWEVVIELPSYATERVRDLASGDDVTLARACDLVIALVDDEGQPVDTGLVIARDCGEPLVRTRALRGTGVIGAPADPLGIVLVPGVPERRLEMFVHVPQRSEPWRFDVDLTQRPVPRTFVLEGLVASVETSAVRLDLGSGSALDAPRWSWGPAGETAAPYEGPLALAVFDLEGREVLGLSARVTGGVLVGASPAEVLFVDHAARDTALVRVDGAPSWCSYGAGDVFAGADPLGGLPVPRAGGRIELRLGEHELEIPVPRSEPGTRVLNVVVPR